MFDKGMFKLNREQRIWKSQLKLSMHINIYINYIYLLNTKNINNLRLKSVVDKCATI